MLKDGVTCRQYNLNVLHGVGRTTSLICEKSEMLEIFLGSVNNRLWFHLGFSRRNASIFSRQSLFYGFTGKKNDKIETHSFRRDNSEYKKLRRRRQGQRRLKNEFLGILKSFTLFITVKTIANLNTGYSDKFKK